MMVEELPSERTGVGSIFSPRLTPRQAHRLVGHADEEPAPIDTERERTIASKLFSARPSDADSA